MSDAHFRVTVPCLRIGHVTEGIDPILTSELRVCWSKPNRDRRWKIPDVVAAFEHQPGHLPLLTLAFMAPADAPSPTIGPQMERDLNDALVRVLPTGASDTF